jgi:hypothetical protein
MTPTAKTVMLCLTTEINICHQSQFSGLGLVTHCAMLYISCSLGNEYMPNNSVARENDNLIMYHCVV